MKALQLFSIEKSSMKGKRKIKTLPSPSSHSFPSAIARIAVSQICQSFGFARCQSSALDALSDIATRYLQIFARYASSNANSSGRTECNLFDVIHAIESMNSNQGFKGAADINQSLMKSGVLFDIMKFVGSINEIPFAKPIPRRNYLKSSDFSSSTSSHKQLLQCPGRQSLPSHIPQWLPPFPDPSTYKKVESRACKGEGSGWLNEGDSDQAMVEGGVRFTEKKHMDCDQERKRILPVERPKVKFKLGMGISVMEVDMRNGVCRGGKRVSWNNKTCIDIDDQSNKNSSSSSSSSSSFKRRRR